MSSSTNNSIYFLMGLGIGVTVGILYTPKAGADTRDFLRSKADEGTKYAKQSTAHALALAKQKAEELKKTAEETIEEGRQAVMTPMANLSSAVEAGKKAYQEASKRTVNDPATS